MRHRLLSLLQVGLVVAGLIATGRPVYAFQEDDRERQEVSQTRSPTPSRTRIRAKSRRANWTAWSRSM